MLATSRTLLYGTGVVPCRWKGVEDCMFEALPDDTHHGPVVVDVTATDEQGASASAQIAGVTCP